MADGQETRGCGYVGHGEGAAGWGLGAWPARFTITFHLFFGVHPWPTGFGSWGSSEKAFLATDAHRWTRMKNLKPQIMRGGILLTETSVLCHTKS